MFDCSQNLKKKKQDLESQKIESEFKRNCIHLLASNLPKKLTQKDVHKSQFSGVTISEVKIFPKHDLR